MLLVIFTHPFFLSMSGQPILGWSVLFIALLTAAQTSGHKYIRIGSAQDVTTKANAGYTLLGGGEDPQSASPSPKYSIGRSYRCKTRPLDRSTIRRDDRPFSPVLSYSLPSK